MYMHICICVNVQIYDVCMTVSCLLHCHSAPPIRWTGPASAPWNHPELSEDTLGIPQGYPRIIEDHHPTMWTHDAVAPP